jgi:DNA polymerase-3 subunit epsilon
MNTRYQANMSASDILSYLLGATPERTARAPKDQRGIYGLVDHHGALRYIGSTSSTTQTFYERIHQRHRTGSENSSHYFSRMYNTGRMWRMRNDPATAKDGSIAKALRNEFISEYCRAIWMPLPDSCDIAGLERDVIALAPAEAVSWNRRATDIYDEPEELVDAIIAKLGYGAGHLAALERQKQRYSAGSTGPVLTSPKPIVSGRAVQPFPEGPFRFVALDVETASNDRGSICQIGVACVRPDNTIDTWVTYVDPEVDHWHFTYLHGISAKTVRGAPRFREVLPVLVDALRGHVIYQHSSFDRGAVAKACQAGNLPTPEWIWKDSVQVARQAWPELKGNGGHGLASLKGYLGLSFEHHDAGEDARAAAEVVLHAEAGRAVAVIAAHSEDDEDYDLIEEIDDGDIIQANVAPASAEVPTAVARLLGQTTLTAGNINNNHIYLRDFFHVFPKEVVGGSNASSAAQQTICVDWGGNSVAVTDLDGTKKFFRKRGWVREFFERTGAIAGDVVLVQVVAPYSYKVSLERQ